MKHAYHSLVALEDARILQAPEEVANRDFLRGATIAADPPPPWAFDIALDGAHPPHLLGGRIPMASKRLLKVLAAAGVDNIQAFPAVLRLRSRRGVSEWRHHFVLNVIGLVDAADLSVSTGTVLGEGEDGPTLIDFDRLVVSHAQTMGLPIFRLFHDPVRLLVDDHVLRALNTHRPAEGWGVAAIEIEMS